MPTREEIEKLMSEFSKGDIVGNKYAGPNNPYRYLMYLGKSTITQGRYRHKGYDCLTYDGRKIQLFRENDPLYLVGHLPEFHSFLAALRELKEGDFIPGVLTCSNCGAQRNKEAVSHASELDLHVDRLQTELDRVRENLMESTARETTLSERVNALLAERDAAIADLYKAKSCNTCAKQYKDDCLLEECMEPCSAFAEGEVPYKWRGAGSKNNVN